MSINKLLIILLVITTFISAGVLSNKDNTPRFIVYDGVFKDLGTIQKEETRDIIYSFYNAGDSLLVIESIKPTCKCTIIDSALSVIPPKEGGKLKFRYEGSKRSGNKVHGVRIRTNEKDISLHKLFFKVRVENPK